MIALDHVTKSYPTVAGPNVVLDDVTTVMPTDRNIGILGHNGAGKSTLLRLLARAEAPNRGRIRSRGRLSWPMAFSGGFQGSLSAIDNIRFVSRIYGADWRQVVVYVEDFAEIGTYMRMPIKTLSTGMRARLSLGLSLAIRFDVYLIDEIPGVGDARFQTRFQAAFDRLREEACLIICSHNSEMIRRYCDIAFVLNAGKLVRFDDIEAALTIYSRT